MLPVLDHLIRLIFKNFSMRAQIGAHIETLASIWKPISVAYAI